MPGMSSRNLEETDVPSELTGESPPEFFLSLEIPTVVDADGTAKPAGNIGETHQGPDQSAVMIPDATHRHDSDFPWEGDPWWVGREVGHDYSVRIPGIVTWNSTLSPEEFGQVVFSPSGPGTLFPRFEDGEDGVLIENQPRGKRKVYLVAKYEDVEDVPAPNYFREAGLSLKVEFRGGSRLSELAPSNPMESQIEYVTPNRSVIGVSDVLSDAITTYNEGVKVSAKIVKLRGAGLLRRFARLAAYDQAQRSGWADEITERELVQDAAVRGMTAFRDKVRDAAGVSDYLDEQVHVAPAGPTVAVRGSSESSALERADLNDDGEISTSELNEAVSDWAAGEYTTDELNEIISAWAAGGD